MIVYLSPEARRTAGLRAQVAAGIRTRSKAIWKSSLAAIVMRLLELRPGCDAIERVCVQRGLEWAAVVMNREALRQITERQAIPALSREERVELGFAGSIHQGRVRGSLRRLEMVNERLLLEMRGVQAVTITELWRTELRTEIKTAVELGRADHWGRRIGAPAARPTHLSVQERMNATIRSRAQLGGAGDLCTAARARGAALTAELQDAVYDVKMVADVWVAGLLRRCDLLRGQITTAANVVTHMTAAQATEDAATRSSIWEIVSGEVERRKQAGLSLEQRRDRQRHQGRQRRKQAGLSPEERRARQEHRGTYATVLAALMQVKQLFCQYPLYLKGLILLYLPVIVI
jgi:hypothetical protein